MAGAPAGQGSAPGSQAQPQLRNSRLRHCARSVPAGAAGRAGHGAVLRGAGRAGGGVRGAAGRAQARPGAVPVTARPSAGAAAPPPPPPSPPRVSHFPHTHTDNRVPAHTHVRARYPRAHNRQSQGDKDTHCYTSHIATHTPTHRRNAGTHGRGSAEHAAARVGGGVYSGPGRAARWRVGGGLAGRPGAGMYCRGGRHRAGAVPRNLPPESGHAVAPAPPPPPLPCPPPPPPPPATFHPPPSSTPATAPPLQPPRRPHSPPPGTSVPRPGTRHLEPGTWDLESVVRCGVVWRGVAGPGSPGRPGQRPGMER